MKFTRQHFPVQVLYVTLNSILANNSGGIRTLDLKDKDVNNSTFRQLIKTELKLKVSVLQRTLESDLLFTYMNYRNQQSILIMCLESLD